MARSISSEQFAEAIFEEAAYDALLTAIANAIDARSIAAGWYYNDGTSSMLIDNGYWSAEQIARYSNEFAAGDIWAQAQLAQWAPGKVTDLANLVSDDQYERSVLWQQFFRDIGDDTWRALCIGVENESGVGGIAFHRGRAQAGFTDSATRLLGRYAGPLSRVHALRGRLSALEKAAATSSRALDAVGRPVFVVTGSAKIVHSNIAAEELLGRDVLRKCRGYLSARSPAADKKLKLAISTAAATPGCNATAIRLAAADDTALGLSILPAPHVRGQPQVIVIADSRAAADVTLEARLRSLYRLSPGEAQIAAMLAAGADPAEIADRRNASVGTVRIQLRSIASKMGCRRQSDIVRTVVNLPPITLVSDA